MAQKEPADVRAIEDSVTDYFQSWFEGDVDRMRRCLHPRLAKRRPPTHGEGDLHEVTYGEMIEDVSGGPKGFDRAIDVTVLERRRRYRNREG